MVTTMQRTSLFAATALAAALAASPAPAQTTRTAPSTTAATTANTNAEWIAQPLGDWRISKLNGLDVYNRANQQLGSIDDILVDRQGQIHAVVLGVGGFLGIGNRLVAVPFSRLQFVYRNSNGQYVDADGAPVVIDNASTAAGTPTTTANRTDQSVGSAVENAGRAVGNAAVVIGNAVGNTVSNAVGGNGLAPDRAVLDATKDQLLNAPQFQYGTGR